MLYGHSSNVAAFQLRNFHAIASLIREHDVACEWEETKGGGCHAYFSQRNFNEARDDVVELQRSDPPLGALVRMVLQRSELAQLRIPNAVGAVVQAHAAKLSPYKLISWILETLIKESKLNLQTNTPVLSLSKSDASPSSWDVHTVRGIISTRYVLFATNAYTSHLLPKFHNLIVPVRGEMSALTPPEILLRKPLQHTYSFIGTMGQDKVQDDYLVQRPVSSAIGEGGQLMYGGGRTIAKHKGVFVDTDDDVDEPVAKYLRTNLPELLDMENDESPLKSSIEAHIEERPKELAAEKEWTGIMGFSRDGFPWVGAVPGMPGLWISAGFTGSGKSPLSVDRQPSLRYRSGMPNAALSAQYVASLVLAASKGKDWRQQERDAVNDAVIPSCYVISRKRMERVRSIPQV